MTTKKNNARIQKWRAMIADGILKDTELLKSRIRKGIPSAMRMLAWPAIIQLEQFIQQKQPEYTYKKLTNSFSNNIYEITLDIPRTFPEEQDSKFLSKSLNNVLKALSIVFPKVGYCQGMNFLVLRLLQVLEDEETFWMMNYLFIHDPCLMNNFIDPNKVERQNYVFSQLMNQKIPKIYSHFQKQNIQAQIFTIRWFMTLFSGVLKQQLFNRMFEIYLNEGWTIIYGVALTLLKSHETKILKNSFEDNLYLINLSIYHIDNNDIFIEDALKWNINLEQITKYTEAYERNLINKNGMKDSQTRRSRDANTRQMQNKKVIVRIPQNENMSTLSFQSKSEEVTFEPFHYLNQLL